jgi:hypothetical protein
MRMFADMGTHQRLALLGQPNDSRVVLHLFFKES